MADNLIKDRWLHDDSLRSEILERARLCASLTKAWVLPPASQNANEKLPENFQSFSARMIENLQGRMLLALYPPGTPWFQLKLAGAIQHDPEVPAEAKQQIADRLFLHELLIVSVLESAHLRPPKGRRLSGFRTNKRDTLGQILITGDSLEQLTDDYRLKNFRRDQYTTKRDSSKDVLYHIVKENIDPLAMDEEMVARSGLNTADLVGKMVADRLTDMYTLVEWQPLSKNWIIRQEINERQVNVSEEKISPFLSTPFELVCGEDYGRGFVEMNLGDIRTFDETREKLIDFAAVASKLLLFIDETSRLREEDLEKPTGSVLRGRVRDGKLLDVAPMVIDKLNDFQVVFQTSNAIREDLAKAGLVESEQQPTGERVTATQITRIAMELEGALGGVYAPIAEEQQLPLLQRTIFQLERDSILPALPEDAVEIEALTGLAALSREVDKARLVGFAQVVSQLGPEALARLDMGILAGVIARLDGISEPGVVKSAETVQAEQQQALALQAQQEAISKGVEVAGNVAEQQAQQPQPA